MKKQTMMKLVLAVLPLLTVAVTAGPGSVTVFDGETTSYYSWLQMVPESLWGWCAPVAALMNHAVFALAVIYGLSGKRWCLRGIGGLAFAAACVAVLPIVIQSEIKIVPNVFGVILLIAEWGAAYLIRKSVAGENAPKGKHLEQH